MKEEEKNGLKENSNGLNQALAQAKLAFSDWIVTRGYFHFLFEKLNVVGKRFCSIKCGPFALCRLVTESGPIVA